MKVNNCLKIGSVGQTGKHAEAQTIRAETHYASKSAAISAAREAQLSKLAVKVLHDNMEAWKTLAKE